MVTRTIYQRYIFFDLYIFACFDVDISRVLGTLVLERSCPENFKAFLFAYEKLYNN